jgi:hypothetical protein
LCAGCGFCPTFHRVRAAVHLAGDESAFTTGIAYVVDGGFTL